MEELDRHISHLVWFDCHQFKVPHGQDYTKCTRDLESVTLQQILFLYFRCATTQMSEASDRVIHPTYLTLLRDVKVPGNGVNYASAS